LHSIFDNRINGTRLKILNAFAGLCGLDAMTNVVIATTMWGNIREGVGERREAWMSEHCWKDMLSEGCRLERFLDTPKSAWHIIGKHSSTTLRLSDEMVAGKSLADTEAFHALRGGLPKWFVHLVKKIPKSAFR
jgi:hypothetical protein